MITPNQIKTIRALHMKKFRDEFRQFIVEGPKITEELLKSDLPVISLFARQEWIDSKQEILSRKNIAPVTVTEKELARISKLSTPNQVLAIVGYLDPISLAEADLKGVSLALDQISDPGNLGTIIRTADWFGIKTIICSENCVDLYNPKVIQSTMGSFMRINILYCKLEEVLSLLKSRIRIFAACTDGEDIRKTEKKKDTLIIIGSESKGISPELEKHIHQKVSIPSQNKAGVFHAESLNASVAAALMCYEFTK